MESAKQAGNMQCSVCSKKKDTLAKREELVWQREDMIHSREKELREWEKILEEKNEVLLEKERQLNFQENVGKTHSLRENSGNTSISNIDNTFSNPKYENNAMQNDNEFLLQKERIILEKEKVISEMIENIEKKEQNIMSKEKLIEDKKSIMNKESEWIVKRTHELDLREQIIKDTEETKLNALFEAKKASDDRIALVSQKEKALSMASQIIHDTERALKERESMLMEKEKNIFTLINSLNEKYILKENPEEESKLFERFDKIFNDRTRILQEREKTIRKKELIIEDKWKHYYKAKDVMKIEEENLKAINDTFEKEKKLLREWEKLFQRQENKTIEKCKSSSEDSACSSSQVEQVLKSFVNYNINTFNRVEKKLDYQSRTPDLESRETSGDELFQFYEKEKELVQSSLLKENMEMPGKELKSDNTENMLNESVQAFFDKVCVTGKETDVNYVSVRNGEKNKLLGSMPVNNRDEKPIVQEISPQNNIVELAATNNSTLKSIDICVPFSNSNKGKKETYEQEAAMSTSMTLEESKQGIEINGTVANNENQVKLGDDNSALQKCVNPCIIQKEENKNNLQKINEISLKESKKVTIDYNSPVVNIVDPDICKTASRSSSVSSIRSQSSSVNGRNSPWLSKPQKKYDRKALLNAVKERNFLEIVKILDSNCVSLEHRDSEGLSALLLAVESGNIELVQRLINMGADIRACDYEGNSAVHIAVSKNYPEILLTLIKNGAPLDVTDNNGKTAMLIATKMKYSSIIGILKKQSLMSS